MPPCARSSAGRYRLAGASLAAAAALRVFPLLFALALGLRALIEALHERRIAGRWRRALCGAALALPLLVAVSIAGAGSGAWSEFAQNSDEHLETSLGNSMGAAAMATVFRASDTEPGAEGRSTGRALPAFVYLSLALVLFGTIFEAARRRSEATILFAASLLAPIGAVDLTCYYYAFLVLLAPLAVARFRRVAALLMMVIATQAIVLTGLDGPGLYAAQTVIVLFAASFAIWDMIGLGEGSRQPDWSLATPTGALPR